MWEDNKGSACNPMKGKGTVKKSTCRRSLPYRNQSIDLRRKSIDWFLYDRDLRHESVKET